MRTSFDFSSKIFNNASRFKFFDHVVEPSEEICAVYGETKEWLRELGDENGEFAKTILALLWRLRSTAVLGLLPYAHPDVRLGETLAQLIRAANVVPALRNRTGKIEAVVKRLSASTENQKMARILELFRSPEFRMPQCQSGMVWYSQAARLPGWGSVLEIELRSKCSRLQILSSSKQLLSGTFEAIILPWGGWRYPYLHELHHCMRSANLHVVRYDLERLYVPPRPILRLSRGGILDGAKEIESLQVQVIDDGEAADEQSYSSFWDSLRQLKGDFKNIDEAGDKMFLADARTILFSNGKKAFLKEKYKVLEVSSAFETGARAAKGFFRVSVSNLKPGDLVILRTSGSQDFLVEVADRLMASEGDRDLRKRALDWKPMLKNALEMFGSAEIVRRLTLSGHGFKSHHKYIWYWTTEDHIKPESEAMFYELVAILEDLGFSVKESDVLETAESRWKLMKKIIRYHIAAGQVIRRLLLEKLKGLIDSGTEISNEYKLTLPEEGAGELTVLRVAEVDTQVVQVPYSQTGILMSAWD